MMRRVTTKFLGQFMAATMLFSPLLAWADVSCRCPDCARSDCVIMSRVCDRQDCSETSPTCDCPDAAPCPDAQAPPDASSNGDSVHPEHSASSEPEGCGCNGYFYTHGNAVLPGIDANASSNTEEFYQQIPTTVITSGWVYQILHPPRLHRS